MKPTFKITRVKQHSPEKLIANLRHVSMLTRPDVFPYTHADIELSRDMEFCEILPAQRYVLSSELRKVQHLAFELAKHNVDLFDLNGYVTIWTDESDEPIDVLPPIIEHTVVCRGCHAWVLNDGMHRMYAARMSWVTPTVVSISTIPDDLPYYAHPINHPEPWDAIDVIPGDIVPHGYIKKWHRIQNNKDLFRNFNSSFLNVGGPRGQASK